MFGWFFLLRETGRKTFWACFAGWALDAFDVQIYALVMPTLIALWGLSKGQAGALGTVALLMSAFGGWIAGVLADRIGRVRVLQITILWFAIFTGLSGLTSSYNELLVTRSLQGLGFGGEWAAGAILMAEVIAPQLRGRAVAVFKADGPSAMVLRFCCSQSSSACCGLVRLGARCFLLALSPASRPC